MHDTIGTVVEKKEVIKGYFYLTMTLALPFQRVVPGQFVMVRVPSADVFLRRPFSIYDYRRGYLKILFRVVGKGTELLSKVESGDKIAILGPLGNGFSLKCDYRAIIVAGGIGVAGIHFFARKMGKSATLFFGCSNISETELFQDLSYLKPFVSTLDGSYGFKGTVIDLLATYLKHHRPHNIHIYACGPEGMIAAMKYLIEKDKIPCQVLVEERMACGMGLCFGCVVKTCDDTEPYKRVCKEGPVFDIWQISL